MRLILTDNDDVSYLLAIVHLLEEFFEKDTKWIMTPTCKPDKDCYVLKVWDNDLVREIEGISYREIFEQVHTWLKKGVEVGGFGQD